MDSNFFNNVHTNPIIGALNNIDHINYIIESPCKIVFLLTGNIMNVTEIVKKLKDNGKLVYVHIDLIEGFSQHPSIMEYISKNVKPDGIISTKSRMIKAAKNYNLFTIQRLFLLDSLALKTGKDSIKSIKPNAVEILPALMPKVIKEIYKETRVPIIAGGLVKDKEDIINGLNAGAIGVSTSNPDVWNM